MNKNNNAQSAAKERNVTKIKGVKINELLMINLQRIKIVLFPLVLQTIRVSKKATKPSVETKGVKLSIRDSVQRCASNLNSWPLGAAPTRELSCFSNWAPPVVGFTAPERTKRPFSLIFIFQICTQRMQPPPPPGVLREIRHHPYSRANTLAGWKRVVRFCWLTYNGVSCFN